jgi:SAM-dependent methyltransferase
MRPGTLLRWYALKDILISEIKEGSAILDIGSYEGYISYNLKKILSNSRITVVDIDKSGLKLAKERGLNTLYASALELPIEDNQIDFVLCLDLIEHVKEDDKLIKEISRVLKRNGKVILTTPMEMGVSIPFLSKEKNESINRDWGHVRKGYSLESIEKMFVDANLIIVKTSTYFNSLSRFIYWLNFFSGIPLKGKSLLFQLAIRLEPYIKYGAEEQIIVGHKGKCD